MLEPKHMALLIYRSLDCIQLQSDSSVSKYGFLVKQGQKRKNWKQRYFILIDNFLFYYESNKVIKILLKFI